MSQYNKKISKWGSDSQNTLLSFTYPEKVNHQYYIKRKYRITIKYLNKNKK